MNKIGVFVCHCGRNIAGTIDIDKVVEAIGKYPGVAHCEDYTYMCSDPGQNLIKSKIKEKSLDSIVVAACSHSLHELTFRKAAQESGINPYLVEIANIREQCSWTHSDQEKATEKAIKIVRSIIEKARLNQSLIPVEVPVTRKALVIGGGVAGIQAALDIADAGYKVVIVERQPSIGGHMAQISETFPTLDCSQCILTPKMVQAAQHPNIELRVYSEIEDIRGSIGNYQAKIRTKASYIDNQKCTGCGLCSTKCPIKVGSEFDEHMGNRKAIFTSFPQAVPNRPVIDSEHCTYFLKGGKCRVCQTICPTQAVDFDQTDAVIEDTFGAIIVATGYELYPRTKLLEYGGEQYADVITGLQFERLLSASGPTEGSVKRPSDGKVPMRIAFISCAGSRDPEHHMQYCSKFCCMYALKHALLYKERVPDGEAVVYTIDVRAGGKDYEEFYIRAKEEQVICLRGKPGRIIKDGDKLMVWSSDTNSGRPVRISFDMVVLALAAVSSSGSGELAQKMKIPINAQGFFSEAHPKLRPVESLVAGFYLAGCCQGPKDIPETVSQASAAASKVVAMFNQEVLYGDPMVAFVDEDLCSGCKICITTCPYNAREFDENKNIVRVNEALCQQCGCCIAACPSNAAQQKNYTDDQLLKMMEAALGGE